MTRFSSMICQRATLLGRVVSTKISSTQDLHCKHCQSTAYYRIHRRQWLQTVSCKRQYSLRAGTMLAFSKISLKIWFMVIVLIIQSKKSLSSLALLRY